MRSDDPWTSLGSVACLAVLALFPLAVSFGQATPRRYALILEDAPVVSQVSSREQVRSASAVQSRRQIEQRQRALRSELATRNIRSTGAVSTLLNAVFVTAPAARLDELKTLPGVRAVVPMRRGSRSLNRATQLSNAPAAWSALNGAGNAGLGIKIGIIDSGIDISHPMLQDSSLSTPAGYPLCTSGDCVFTNSKVIVARSYVRLLSEGSQPDPAVDSRPDDYSARDRDGHGTAVASVAAGASVSAAFPISGMAPKAWLGNYKIYGSPQVNDYTFEDVILQALEDAFNDGMDIVSMSSGLPPFTGPLDTGAACGNSPGIPCDLIATAFENMAAKGVVVVVSAGNGGNDGVNYPTYGSITSPASAPSVIAVGATSNSHAFDVTVSVAGSDVPSNLQAIATQTGDAYVAPGALTDPLVDVTSIGDDGYGCSEFPIGSLTGSIALIKRGPSATFCEFATKAGNAWDAGAQGVILYMSDASAPVSPAGLANIGIPVVMISASDAAALKSFLAAHPGRKVTINPAGVELSQMPNIMRSFSSTGPAIGGGLKPDLVAPGDSIYMAAQTYDPLGALYSSSGYSVAGGTSFSAPMTAGTAALVKQKHRDFSSAQVKSALVDTSAQDVTLDDGGKRIDVRWTGAGRLDAGAAVSGTITAVPATLSFGILSAGALPKAIPVEITNHGTAAVTLALAVTANQTASATVSVSKATLALAPGSSETVTVTLAGTIPAAGSYSGRMTIQGGAVALHLPYLFTVASGLQANIIPLAGTGFYGTVNQPIPGDIISFRLSDPSGVPIAGVAVDWVASGVTFTSADTATDGNGVASAEPVLGAETGAYSITGIAAGALRMVFSGYARPAPAITAAGVVNAASFESGRAVAPGSYISIFGSNVSDFSDYAATVPLPLAIDSARISFDVPGAGISVPGRLLFVSPTQVNLQVPWELQGQTGVEVKVAIGDTNGDVVTVPLAAYSPAFFESGGAVAALDTAYQPITASNPARRGQVVQLFCNGLGPVTNQPASGESASATELSMTRATPAVTIGGQDAPVSFSGLAPGFPGLYQVNATVPANLAAGTQPIVLSIGDQASKPSTIAVQ